jgi:2-C-methyl-D-erythritol 4-phosphate cytidylyltransferase
MDKKNSLIFLAGGKGTRIGSSIPKQFLLINNKPIALYSFEVFLSISAISEIIVVCEKEYRHLFKSNKSIFFASPGKRRQDSVFNAFKMLKKTNNVLIHDSARPFVDRKSILKLLDTMLKEKAAVLAYPVSSTIKKCENDFVIETLDRSKLFEIQTPQAISFDLLKKGFNYINQKKIDVTDDVSIVELMGYPVKIVIGNSNNVKITTPHDLEIAKKIL